MVNPITNYIHIDMINTIISLTITLMSSMRHELCLIILTFKNKHLIRKAVVLLVVQFDFLDDDDT